ncbi:MAG: hypothetical protein ACE5HM_05660, partial [Acidiferrobacterales bacterium]
MLALDELRKKVDEFVGRLSLRKAFNVLITLIIFAPMYYLLHPRWLHWTVALLIALILAVAVIWLYDDPPKKRIWIGLAWVGLFGLWYCFHLAWLSAISAVILALLIAVLAYGIRRPSLPKPRAYYIEPWDTDRQNLLLEAWKQT